jgi:hypothetical protein
VSRYIHAMTCVLHHRLQEIDGAILATKDAAQVRRLARMRRALVRRWKFLIGAKPPLL